MRVIRIAAAVLMSTAWMGQIYAADFDGKKPFVCALLDLTSCTPGGDCERENSGERECPAVYLHRRPAEQDLRGKTGRPSSDDEDRA